MSDLERFNKLVDDIWKMVFGTERRPKTERAKGYTEEHTQQWLDSVKKPKRARNKNGRYRGDDKTTPDINEAWVGGKAPKKRRKNETD